jgi:ubiquinone/menaquinone biosynthesis C-methylase UbiE
VIERLGRKFARVATDAVVRRPGTWRLFRGLMRRQFDRLAPVWDEMLSPDGMASFEAALAALPTSPERVLDVGTGTGRAALVIARRYDGAKVVGVDMAEEMLSHARRKVPPELNGRVSFEVGDAARLPFADGSFDLVTHANMIPFFDEVARVLRPGGHAIFAFSSGPDTPIYVEPERLRRELENRGFEEIREVAGGAGTAMVARKKPSP